MAGRRTVTAVDVFSGDKDPNITAAYISRVRGADAEQEPAIETPAGDSAGSTPEPGLPTPQTPAAAATAEGEGEAFALPADLTELFVGPSDVTSIRVPAAVMTALREFSREHKDNMGEVISLGLLEVFRMTPETYAEKMNDVWQMVQDGKRLSRRR